MSTIAIIGGGWLGRPLAHHLVTMGHQISVTKTNDQGVEQLSKEQLNALKVNLANDTVQEVAAKLDTMRCETVIGSFPPGFRKGKAADYAMWWETLIKACQQAKVRRVVMISSTTVYPNLAQDMPEEMADWTLADSNPTYSENAQIMLRAEQLVKESGIGFAIVRCSGLVGPERHPARFVPKLKQVSALAPANMLHLTDAIGTIHFVAERDDDIVVNATTPNTTNKAEFYQAALNSVNSDEPLPPIVERADKRIIPDRLLQLGYRFHFNHTLELL